MNWVDGLILLVLLAFAAHGWRKGFILLFVELVGFLATIIVPLLLYRELSPALEKSLGWTYAIAKAGSFTILWTLTWIVYALIARAFYKLIPKFIHKSLLNKAAGAIPSLIKGLVLVSLFVTLIVIYPSSGSTKKAVLTSAFGSRMIKVVSAGERVAANIFSEAIQETLTFLTVEPKPTSGEVIQLKFKTREVQADPQAERAMLAMVNQERKKHGLAPLKWDTKLQSVARAHSKDMFARGYFSHVTPDGVNPFKRMRLAGIHYRSAGENLALAPTLEIAHRGLMKSPGHRANILSPDYKKVGIGIVENDVYGMMFSQEFTN